MGPDGEYGSVKYGKGKPGEPGSTEPGSPGYIGPGGSPGTTPGSPGFGSSTRKKSAKLYRPNKLQGDCLYGSGGSFAAQAWKPDGHE